MAIRKGRRSVEGHNVVQRHLTSEMTCKSLVIVFICHFICHDVKLVLDHIVGGEVRGHTVCKLSDPSETQRSNSSASKEAHSDNITDATSPHRTCIGVSSSGEGALQGKSTKKTHPGAGAWGQRSRSRCHRPYDRIRSGGQKGKEPDAVLKFEQSFPVKPVLRPAQFSY